MKSDASEAFIIECLLVFFLLVLTALLLVCFAVGGAVILTAWVFSMPLRLLRWVRT